MLTMCLPNNMKIRFCVKVCPLVKCFACFNPVAECLNLKVA